MEENAGKCQDFARHAQGGISKVNVQICISARKRVRVERTDVNGGLGNAQQKRVRGPTAVTTEDR